MGIGRPGHAGGPPILPRPDRAPPLFGAQRETHHVGLHTKEWQKCQNGLSLLGLITQPAVAIPPPAQPCARHFARPACFDQGLDRPATHPNLAGCQQGRLAIRADDDAQAGSDFERAATTGTGQSLNARLRCRVTHTLRATQYASRVKGTAVMAKAMNLANRLPISNPSAPNRIRPSTATST